MHLVVEVLIFTLLYLCKGWYDVTSWTCIWKVRTFAGPQTVLTRCLCYVSALQIISGTVPRLGITASFLPSFLSSFLPSYLCSFVRVPLLFAEQQLPCRWMPCSICGLEYTDGMLLPCSLNYVMFFSHCCISHLKHRSVYPAHLFVVIGHTLWCFLLRIFLHPLGNLLQSYTKHVLLANCGAARSKQGCHVSVFRTNDALCHRCALRSFANVN